MRRRTTCNRDCPDACGLEVTVEDGRATALRGDPDDPITRGFLCERTNLFLHRQYAADRFRQPMWRREKGAPLTPLGWDAALDLVAERMLRFRDEDGPASILHYQSGGSLGILKCLASHLFEQFGEFGAEFPGQAPVKVFLARKVLIKGRPRTPRHVGDRLDAGSGAAVLGKGLVGGCNDAQLGRPSSVADCGIRSERCPP